MRLNLLKAIKNIHRNPISRLLHLIGLSLYIVGFILIVCCYSDSDSLNISSPIYGIILFLIAVGLFLMSHKIEGNLSAMTLIVVMKYLNSQLRFR
jgi:hypothetical protein